MIVRPAKSAASPTKYSVFAAGVAISIDVSSIALIVTLNVAVLPSYSTVSVFAPAVCESKPVTA